MSTLLTFRLDRATREALRARLARDGLTLSSVVTRGLRDYVASAGSSSAATRVRELPENVVAWLRDLRSSGKSEVLSAALADLHERGWPLERLARALGVSKQAVQSRIRRASGAIEAPGAIDVPGIARHRAPAARARPHLTVRCDHALRAAAHRAAADEGSSLSQVIERILHRYLNSRLAPAGGSVPCARCRPAARSRHSQRFARIAATFT
jgi:antitoxin component of RelBE/YafQ-DinJ toxin-antitoxin module